MPAAHGYACRSCGTWHDELPFSFHAHAPAAWSPNLANDADSQLGEEQCIIENELFFVRGLVRLPVSDSDQDFEWGVWVSVSEPDFDRMSEVWNEEGRENEPVVRGYLASTLPAYTPQTLGLTAMVRTQPVGLRRSSNSNPPIIPSQSNSARASIYDESRPSPNSFSTERERRAGAVSAARREPRSLRSTYA